MGRGFPTPFCKLALKALWILQCALSASAAPGSVGVVYGWAQGDNLPIPSQAVELMNKIGVTQVRIYDTNQDVLQALSGSYMQVIVGITNDELATVGASNATVAAWVVNNIVPFATSVNITAIAVGSEVMTAAPTYTDTLVRIMTWIHEALVTNNNLAARIKVTTPMSTALLSSSYPPSQAVFNQTLVPAIRPLLAFLTQTGSYFMLNVHTFDAFQENSASITLKYALFQPDVPTRDIYSSLNYSSLYDALLDSGYAAMKALNYSNLKIVVGETGWPSLGDSNENGANATNAQMYNSNLVKHVLYSSGTPANQKFPMASYIYELFNEDLRTGPTSERNYGLFSYKVSPVYSLDITGQGRVLTENGTQYQTWCVAKQLGNVDLPSLQAALDWSCGGEGNVNCSTTEPGGPCFLPDTIQNHASWVFNTYYQQNGNAPGTCDFNGVATIVSYNPSYGSCFFQASNITTTMGGAPTPGKNPNSVHSTQFQTELTIACLFIVCFLNFRYLLV